MVLYGDQMDTKSFRDLFVCMSLGNQCNHFMFTVR
jgi:hypothetical protein